MARAQADVPRTLFAPIASRYALPAEILSFGQYGRWRRALVRGLAPSAGARVLDVATGTGLIARDIERRWGCPVIGCDVTEAMLSHGSGLRVVADARALPFRDHAFDVVTFSYLLRYVEDVPAAVREVARVVAPGGTLGSVEFGVPSGRLARAGWRLYASVAFPVLATLFGRGWRAVGAFLGPSIRAWARNWPIDRQVRAWEDAGVRVTRARRLSLGAGVVMIGRKA